MSRRITLPSLLALLILAASLASPAALAGDCWGCHSYSCMQGFDAGGLFCEEISASCGFLYTLLGINCELRSCKTSGACPRSIDAPDRSIDPSRRGGDQGSSAGFSR